MNRIADALERIAAAMEKKKAAPVESKKAPNVGALIKSYVDSWQMRYQTKARPEVSKAIGVFRALLEDRAEGELMELVQVYCQMEDPWFLTKRHDIVTFRENITKVALARDKGTEQNAMNWNTVWNEQEAPHDQGTLRAGDGEALPEFRREEILSPHASRLISGTPKRPRR